MGHSICIRAFVHVGHTRSLSVHVAHYHMMCAYVTRRGTIGYYIRCMRGASFSVCSINGRERLHAKVYVKTYRRNSM